MLLTDREALAASLASSHEGRLAAAAAAEASLREREEARCGGALRAARSEELRRNRARLTEIRQLVTAAAARVEAAGLVVVDTGVAAARPTPPGGPMAVTAAPARSITARRTVAMLGPGPILPAGPP